MVKFRIGDSVSVLGKVVDVQPYDDYPLAKIEVQGGSACNVWVRLDQLKLLESPFKVGDTVLEHGMDTPAKIVLIHDKGVVLERPETGLDIAHIEDLTRLED